MDGFDREKAAAYILPRLDLKAYRTLGPVAGEVLGQVIAADSAYMAESGVFDGNAYYDDDEAYEYILDRVAAQRRTPEKQMDELCDFIDSYMELQEEFLSQEGLIDWE